MGEVQDKMKFNIIEHKDNKLVIEYDKVFEDAVCALKDWDKITEFRIQYFLSEAMYTYINNQSKLKPKSKKRR